MIEAIRTVALQYIEVQMITIRLFLSLCFLTGLAIAQESYQHLDTADFIDPSTPTGRPSAFSMHRARH
jgi:hypothetical protein